jgi:hypothetical protein
MFAKVLASKKIPAVLDRDRPSLACRPPNLLCPPTFCDSTIVCEPEGPEHLDLLSREPRYLISRARSTFAGHRRRVTRPGHVDHAFAAPPRAGACPGIFEQPPRCHCSGFSKGVRARFWRHKGCHHGSSCEAEMCAPAASGALPIIRYVCGMSSLHSPYRMPAPVDHIYYSKHTFGLLAWQTSLRKHQTWSERELCRALG